MDRGTLPPLWRDLMKAPSMEFPYCPICGRTGHLEKHHIVKRSAGKMLREDGTEVPKPTITLCGHGNADGCHGLAHANRLHFRWVETRKVEPTQYSIGGGHLEYIVTDEPVKYQEALGMKGWRRVNG